MAEPKAKTHQERAQEAAEDVCYNPFCEEANEAVIARIMFPAELVTWLGEACTELEFQADNYDCDCDPDRHLCCVPRLYTIAAKGRAALALYPNPKQEPPE